MFKKWNFNKIKYINIIKKKIIHLKQVFFYAHFGCFMHNLIRKNIIFILFNRNNINRRIFLFYYRYN